MVGTRSKTWTVPGLDCRGDMSILRRIALPIYRWSTRSKRAALARRFDETQQWPAAILFYHRVADRVQNTWSIGCTRFEEQLDLIGSLGTFASLDEIRQEQLSGTRDRLKIAITFDDGYSENMDRAIPELLRRKIPCTYFVATDFVEYSQPFPHDIQRGYPLSPNSKEEIRAIADLGIEIGGHTRSHLDLGQEWQTEKLRRELCDSRKKLQDWTGQSIEYFSFPYGLIHNISQAAIDMIAEAGYKAFVSALGLWNAPGGDSFHMSRIHGDPCTEALRNWLTLDPRRIDRKSPLRYKKPALLNDSLTTKHTRPGNAFPSLEFAINTSFSVQSPQ